MPEGPELHLASLFVKRMCSGLKFAGKVEKSAVNKNPEVPFNCPEYTIGAVSRGKEVKLILSPVSDKYEVMPIVFRFGMSGSFKFTTVDEIPKHSHLRFYTKNTPKHVLSFVDARRFGSWEFNGSWQPIRGPCVMTEYEKFRENVLKNLSDKAFDKPICEALLNQKYFNGIGNYLRAEILYRSKIAPFMQARAVLEAVKHHDENTETSLSKKIKIKKENPDLLQLCHLLPLEVLKLEGKGYDPGRAEDYSVFITWLQCYFVPGMKTMKDSSGRTIYFQGEPGPLAPKGNKVKKARKKSVAEDHKPLKVDTTSTKRKIGKESLKNIKKDIKAEPEEETTPKKRRVKVEKVVEEQKTKKGGRTKRIPRVKKTNKEADENVRKTSPRGSALKSPSKGRSARLQSTTSAVSPKPRSRKLKSEMSRTTRKSPKQQQLKSNTNSTPRNSPRTKIRTRRKAAVREAEGKP